MKKIDTTKPAIHKEWDALAKFKFDFLDSTRRRVLVWLCEFGDGAEEPSGSCYLRETDEFGRMPNGGHIINAQKTITFWVPCWLNECGEVRVKPNFSRLVAEKPLKMCMYGEGKGWEWLGWKGPFTITVDD